MRLRISPWLWFRWGRHQLGCCATGSRRGTVSRRDWFTGTRIYDSAIGKSHGTEQHYIFPKALLKNVGITDSKRTNEVANRAILCQKPSLSHRKASPADYLPEIDGNHPGALSAQSVPINSNLWAPEQFLDFLTARRRLLAKAMNEFVEGWLPEIDPDIKDEHGVRHLIAGGENKMLEFKSSLRWDMDKQQVNKNLEGVVVKTLAGFLNTDGGTLVIGVDDSGGIIGLAGDYGSLKDQSRDAFERHLQQVVARDLGDALSASYLTVNFHEIDGEDICQVTVDPSNQPVYVENPDQALFYVRSGNLTRSLPVDETVKFVQHRWGSVSGG